MTNLAKVEQKTCVPFVSCFVILNYAGSTAFVASGDPDHNEVDPHLIRIFHETIGFLRDLMSSRQGRWALTEKAYQ